MHILDIVVTNNRQAITSSEVLTDSLSQLRNRHYLLLDILFLLLVPTLALIIRMDTIFLPDQLHLGLGVFTIVNLFIFMIIFYLSGIYRRYWLYASVNDLLQITRATLLATFIIGLLTLGFLRLTSISLPRSVVPITGMLILGLCGGVRFLVRYGYSRRYITTGRRQRALVLGAGDAGTMIVREMLGKPHLGYEPIAFLDDDPHKQKLWIHGLPVLGGLQDLDRVIRTYRPSCVIIAMPTAPGEIIQEISSTCDLLQVEKKTVPDIFQILDGRVSVGQLRDVNIQDLLRREPIRTDIDIVRHTLVGRRVLVTGGGGSIGGELCRQILYCRPQELIVLGHGENSVFEIMTDLHRAGVSETVLTPVIADIRFEERIQAVFAACRPHVVFHAAAHKHVPLMEWCPSEAITNNVLGTQVLLSAAEANDTERFVLISTDKAVNPTSVMGASKRVAELLVCDTAQRCQRAFVSVRFGNVLGSRGSVVFTFKNQIADGGPLTVTDPRVKRFFMTIPEAVQLVLQASVLGRRGEVLVLDMGDPVAIDDLARRMIRLYGLEPERDISIQYIGLRDGEKLSEELFFNDEILQTTIHRQILVAQNGNGLGSSELKAEVAELVDAARKGKPKAIGDSLRQLVPEYSAGDE